MRKSKYSEEQIIGFLKQAEAGMPSGGTRCGGADRVGHAPAA